MSTPQAQFIAELVLQGALTDEEAASLVQGPDPPLVERVPHAGLCIGHVVISYCPWCGSDLRTADAGGLAVASSKAKPVHVIVGPEGNVDVFVDGELTTATVASLLSDNEDTPRD